MAKASKKQSPVGAKLLMFDPSVIRSLNAMLKPFGVALRHGSFGRIDDCFYVWVEEDGGAQVSSELIKAARQVWNAYREFGPVDDGRPEGDAFEASLDELMKTTVEARCVLEARK